MDSQRFFIYNEINKLFMPLSSKSKDSFFLCIDEEKKKVYEKIMLERRIGSPSQYGEAYKASYEKHFLAIKKIPINFEIEQIYEILKKPCISDDWYAEIIVLNRLKNLVINNICPNFPLMYDYFFCNSCTFYNKKLIENGFQNSPCLLIFNELEDMDLHEWFKTKRSDAEVASAYFQIYVGIWAMQKYFNMIHYDMHWGNVLCRRVQSGGYFKYTIDEIDYYVPNYGFLFIIWDFGMANIFREIENLGQQHNYLKELKRYPPQSVDYIKITGMIGIAFDEYNTVSKKIVNFTNVIMNNGILGIFINMIIHSFFKNYKEIQQDIRGIYSLDKILFEKTQTGNTIKTDNILKKQIEEKIENNFTPQSSYKPESIISSISPLKWGDISPSELMSFENDMKMMDIGISTPKSKKVKSNIMNKKSFKKISSKKYKSH